VCIIRYSRAWGRIRGERKLLPAAFDDADEELGETLHSLSGADNYADWIYDLVEPHLGEAVLEIGAGHGTMTERLARNGRRVMATDVSTRCTDLLARTFAGHPAVQVFTGLATPETVKTDYDSVVLINVLEHIEDDVAALKDLSAMLKPGGRIIVLVPAFDALYSDFDARIGHRRRYRRSTLAGAAGAAGLEVDDLHYVNWLGGLAWFFFARMLHQTPTQAWSVKLFDRIGVPLVRRREERSSPRFGQSVFCVARKPDD
jgi:2-polyprenyl-3-methyl-5-hydroxy-6-metoxy-1,4-benzoquinol methylase